MSDDPLLTVPEIAAELRVSAMTIYRLIKDGELRVLRIGRVYRIRTSELERYLGER